MTIAKMKNLAMRLHKDEAGPNTVEWVLLIMVALVLLIVIIAAARWAIANMDTAADQAAQDMNDAQNTDFSPGS